MNLEHQEKKFSPKMEHFFPQNLGEDQKKRSSPKMEHFSPPNSSEHLRSDAHWSQTIERDANVLEFSFFLR